ncbi:MAG: hypothetical protein WC632_08165 [Candidatus Margulisiibacteriota bacterium]
MAEERVASALDVIERLIVDGQKEVMQGILQLQSGQDELRTGQDELRGGLNELREGQRSIIDWVKKIDKKHDVNADAHYDLLQAVKKDVGEVKEKLEAHMRQPAHA